MVITAGVPVGISGTTNMIKAHLVGDALLSGIGIGKRNGVGVACVCRSDDEVRSKFKPGNVLVVPATNNNMLDSIRDASAIIAEEAGVIPTPPSLALRWANRLSWARRALPASCTTVCAFRWTESAAWCIDAQ